MTDSAPARRSFLRFGLGHLFVFTLGLAAGLAPLKLWELNAPPQTQIHTRLLVARLSPEAQKTLGLSDEMVMTFGPSTDSKTPTIQERIVKLAEKGPGQVITHPRLTTLSGQRVMLQTNSSISLTEGRMVRFKPVDLQLELQPTLLRNSRIQCVVGLKTTEMATSVQPGGSSVQPTRTSTLETTIEARPGETVVLRTSQDNRDDGTELVVVLTMQPQ
jgi:hypothetical protein